MVLRRQRQSSDAAGRLETSEGAAEAAAARGRCGVSDAACTRPVLRYHGGKWNLADWIIQHFPEHRTYVEPFGGAASVLLRKPRAFHEVYNDMDGEVVNLFRVLRERGPELLAAIELTPFARAEFDLSYEPSYDAIERARRTLVRSHMGYGSNLTRPTESGRPQRTGFRRYGRARGSVPQVDWARLPVAIAAVVERLRGVVIEQRDAIEVLSNYDAPDALHYVDPPYVPESRDAGADYRHEMSAEDHERLAHTLHDLKGAVVLSGYASRLYDRLYGGWRRVEMATHADGARKRTEVLWLSAKCWSVGLFA